MDKMKKIMLMALGVICIILTAAPSFAREFNLKDAGVSLWIFLGIGAMIVLLQLIPAGILFFSFIGSASSIAFGRKRASEERGAERGESQIVSNGPLTVHK